MLIENTDVIDKEGKAIVEVIEDDILFEGGDDVIVEVISEDFEEDYILFEGKKNVIVYVTVEARTPSRSRRASARMKESCEKDSPRSKQ
ncbi:hypothetical protein LJC26_05790 [Desulfovibrio sp. OttesenSCG-928-O18]|nr:hypothetical protein [Desulfovibrio sp. OttesenSCG-928-O18]